MDKLKNFLNFVREQGVAGLAVGFILGGSVAKLVSSLINDIINPILGLILGFSDNLSLQYIQIGKAKVLYGSFINSFIDFVVIAGVVYFGVRLLKLDKLDKKKE